MYDVRAIESNVKLVLLVLGKICLCSFTVIFCSGLLLLNITTL